MATGNGTLRRRTFRRMDIFCILSDSAIRKFSYSLANVHLYRFSFYATIKI